jgi:hypothetical protein
MLVKLKLNRVRKASIIAIFSVAGICICVASLRVANVGQTDRNKPPSPSWLALWGMIEASVGSSAVAR